ncbi:MAG: peptidase, partial [Gammaproteobacteria bacterium]|nr:peptidase [Gammaproteobacteria bacterium]
MNWLALAIRRCTIILMAAAAANAPALAEQALLPVHVDLAGGRILLTLPPPDGDGVYGRFLYAASMQTGLGSAAVTLDRGLIGGTQLVDFRRVGTKVAVAFENPRFRAQGGTAAERRGVSESFPTDVVWMSTPVSTTPAGGVV